VYRIAGTIPEIPELGGESSHDNRQNRKRNKMWIVTNSFKKEHDMKYCIDSHEEGHPISEQEIHYGDLFIYCPFCGRLLKTKKPEDYIKSKKGKKLLRRRK